METRDATPGWEDILDSDEDLIWQGNPRPGLTSPGKTVFLSIFGLPFLGAGLAVFGFGVFALFSLGGSADIVSALFAIPFSVPFIGVGLHLVVFSWYKALTAHRHVHYSLSNKRAYIATDYWKRTLESYPVRPDSRIQLDTGGRGDTVWFDVKTRRGQKGRTIETPVGFEHIVDGSRVYRLLRDIQREQTQ
ncbi:hypothetical protein [Oceaniglobus indicus]|uniref:hypothetical protein n=1 Tax=Oceaniglobus indicus TaxID=2047749 RepID=UPI000C18168C|nr:hypothetical protein [Oceaniglobus indicus]